MPVSDYAKYILKNATELSWPRKWTPPKNVGTGPVYVKDSAGQHRQIENCAVIGGGGMGKGIIISLLQAGFRTTLIEQDEQSLASRVADLWETLFDELQKGRVTKTAVINAGERFRATTDFEALRNTDFVIEAVFETMALKRDVFRKLDLVCPDHAILCTNTSTLDIESIARSTKRPANVVGMHFFIPAHINRCLELIYSQSTTSREAIEAVLSVALRMSKIPMVMRNAPAFVGNRMFRLYIAEALLLLDQGHEPHEIDTAFRNFGFVLGPFQTVDVIGVDTLHRIATENSWNLSSVIDSLLKAGRLGRKTGSGFYTYRKGHRQVDPELDKLLGKGNVKKAQQSLTQEDMIRICLYPLVNEGFNILEEQIVERAEVVDAIYLSGFGWPLSKGGPMYWAQTVGLRNILEYLTQQKRTNPNYPWQPSPLLVRLVENKKEKFIDDRSNEFSKL